MAQTWQQHEATLFDAAEKAKTSAPRTKAINKDRKACRTIEIIKAGRKAGKTDEAIVAELAAEGLTWADQDF